MCLPLLQHTVILVPELFVTAFRKAYREEQRAQERKERDEERARRAREARGPPYSQQIHQCTQVLAWCKQYLKAEAANGATDGAGASNGAAAPAAAFEGMVMKSKKGEDAGDDVFTTSRTKSAILNTHDLWQLCCFSTHMSVQESGRSPIMQHLIHTLDRMTMPNHAQCI